MSKTENNETITVVVSHKVNINQDTVYQLDKKCLERVVEEVEGKSLEEISDHIIDNPILYADALTDIEPIEVVYAQWADEPFGEPDVTPYVGADVGYMIRRDHWKNAYVIPSSAIDLHTSQDDRELAEKIDRLAEGKEVSHV